MNTQWISVADYLLLRLKELNLDKIFQVPGDYVEEFITALERFEGIDAVGDVTELGAGYAADGYARFKGIGAVSVQYGVGTFNVLNAIAGAYVERNPIVVITASPSLNDRKVLQQTHARFHHSIGIPDCDKTIFEHVTVAAEILSHHVNAPTQIDSALEAALLHRRPIYLEAWQNVWGELVPPPRQPLSQITLAPSKAMQTNLITAIEHQLRQAKRPLLMLGIELSRLGLQQEITTLIETLNIPYTTTALAKSLISEAHGVGKENFIGTYSGEASRQATQDIIEEADFILALGAMFTDDYLPLLQHKQDQLIRVNMSDALGEKNDPYLQVSLTDTIDQLTYGFKSPSPITNWCPTLLNDNRLPFPEHHEKITYEGFFSAYQRALEHNDTIQNSNLILGESSSLNIAARLSGFNESHFICDDAWGSIGHETGSALGISMASQRQSIVVTGDGGLMMMCQALSTLSKHHSNSVVFVMKNDVYAIEQSSVDSCALTSGDQLAPFNDLPSWNYKALAEAFNTAYLHVETVGDLDSVLDKISVESTQPTLVQVDINKPDLAPETRSIAGSVTEQDINECPINNAQHTSVEEPSWTI
ncbi:thiamine pyrophosphate-dependent enzyme [Vibrio kagoshimensis]|uniref:thiamine pyrophosphate-binding protein n=1 Tax=Vibrio kagoshimensis TaxID=2910244 RepID=UPI003D1CEC8C